MSEKHTGIRDNTLKMLHNRPASLSFGKIAEATGLTVGWLKAFSRGQIENPGVNTVEALQAYLSEATNNS